MATFTKLSDIQAQFEIIIPKEQFEAALDKAFKKTANKFPIPGFRKGKAPRKMIEKNYGEGAFFDAAFDEVYFENYMAAVKEAGVLPVDYPEIEITEIGADKDCIFVAKVDIKPEISLSESQYKGIEVEKVEYNVTDEQVDSQIEKQLEKLARFENVERPVENGDQTTIDYSGSVDGVKFDGGTAEGQTLVIGSNQFIPGFEEQVIGMTKGEEKDIKVTFPEEYHSAELSGKQAVFAVKLHDIKVKQIPEMDDDFAKDVSEFDTLAEFKADTREKMEKDAAGRADAQVKNNAVNALVAATSFEVPKAMTNREVERALQDMEARMKQQGISLEDYCMYTGSTMEKVKEEIAPEAEKRVKADIILEAIVKKEDIKVTDEELDAEVDGFAKAYGKTLEDAKKDFSVQDFVNIRIDLGIRKAVDVVIANAKLVDAKAE